jgi:hypothetical protein
MNGRFPRTLNEAFPSAYAWRNVITHHSRPLAALVWDVIFTVLLSCAAAVGLFVYLSR